MTMTRRERLLRSCDHADPDGCWPWHAACVGRGTPIFSFWEQVDGKERSTSRSARRVMWEEFVGPIPDGLKVSTGETCVQTCVNPAHLRLRTHRQVMMRGAAARRARSTTCRNGHLRTFENTYVHPTLGWRACKICATESRTRRRYG